MIFNVKDLLFLFVLLLTFASCEQNNTSEKILKVVKDYTDPRDLQGYGTIKIDEEVWMKENIRYDVDGSLTGRDIDGGRFYSWFQAQKACPPGWALPSREQLYKLMKTPDHLKALAIEKAGGMFVGSGSLIDSIDERSVYKEKEGIRNAYLWAADEELIYKKDTSFSLEVVQRIPINIEQGIYLYNKPSEEGELKWKEGVQLGAIHHRHYLIISSGGDIVVEAVNKDDEYYYPCRCVRNK